MQVNVHTAKMTLPNLILRAEAGEEAVIARLGKPALRLVRVKDGTARTFGKFKDLSVEGDLLEPLDEKELSAWEG